VIGISQGIRVQRRTPDFLAIEPTFKFIGFVTPPQRCRGLRSDFVTRLRIST
jgi:hypothetical protein